MLESLEPMKIVCLGDSITLGTPYVGANETYESFLYELLCNNGLNVQIINSGIGGETTRGGLARFEADVIGHSPACVIIMYGANDSHVEQGKSSPRVSIEDFEKNLLRMIELAQNANIEPILMTTLPIGDKNSGITWSPYKEMGANCMVPEYVNCVRKIASEEIVCLVDNYSVWSIADTDDLTVDGVHPKAEGYALIARTIQPVIGTFMNATILTDSTQH